MNFESASSIEKKREDLRAARHQYLEKAKEKYEKDERRAELAKQRGEDSWMLPALSDRLEREKLSLKASKKKKKKEKKKKKHKKKEKKRKKDSSSSSDSSSEDEEEEPKWVEKADKAKPPQEDSVIGAVKGPRLQRDSWMETPIDLFPTVTRQELIDKRNKEKEEQEKQKQLAEKPGLHTKELNPYWKDGGTGLPDEDKVKDKARGPGDGGLSWLRKAYQRCVEQAKEEGGNLEEMAAERWGSLENIQRMIKEAEATCGHGPRRDRDDRPRNRFIKPGDSDSGSNNSRQYKRPRSRSHSRSPVRHSSEDKRDGSYNKYSDRKRYDSRSPSKEKRKRSMSRDRYSKRSRSRDRNLKRSRSKDRYLKRSRSRSRDRYSKRSRSRSRERQRRSRSRDRYRDQGREGSGSISGRSSMKSRFMKPGEMSNSGGQVQSSSKSSSNAPAWKKREFIKPDPDGPDKSAKDGKNDGKKKERRRRSSSTSSSSSSSDTSESSSSSEDQKESSPPPPPPVTILTEKEMNELGAKILRMEIMGNKDQAEKLKQKLEAAREAKKNAPAIPASTDRRTAREDDDEFVTLTRTDRSGLARPVPDSKHPVEPRKGRRKKQKVETHTGKTGERTKYFDDDDKYDLKTMVEREKMGTAEDQNQMFARLAGRSAEKTDDDFQVDDVFLSKADKKQSESIEEQRDRAKAIGEHRKMAKSLSKCRLCFTNIKKHLIIAIGTKAYLCLPETKSLTDGHCMIVPMQHVAAATAMDEDVWAEIQVFRKCLTRMFEEKDEDVVFLETSMRRHTFPHMCLHCIPIEKEVGDLAPIYFKKAIQESESEWSQNKKVVDLSKKDVRHSIPKGFPYFAVDFGYQGGFAHVIEDENKFPTYFGQEIIGGMIDADHQLWRKPPLENFDNQRKKVLRFAEMWKPHDWTQNIAKKTTNDDSDSD